MTGAEYGAVRRLSPLGGEDGIPVMDSDPRGDYVSFEDYAALAGEIERLTAANAVHWQQHAEARIEHARLLADRARMEAALALAESCIEEAASLADSVTDCIGRSGEVSRLAECSLKDLRFKAADFASSATLEAIRAARAAIGKDVAK